MKAEQQTKTPAIGDIIWFFDQNRRIYPKDSGIGGSPIYREHWRRVTITGETSRSWIVDYFDRRVPKNGPHPGFAFTEQEIDDACWLYKHRYRLSNAVERLRDPALLRRVAALIGYDPLPATGAAEEGR